MTKQEMLHLHREDVVSQYQNGASTVEIAKRYKCNPGTVYYFLSDCGVKLRTKQKFKGRALDYKDDVLGLWSTGYSTIAISKETGLSRSTVQRLLRRLGEDTTRYQKANPDNLLKDKSEKVLKLHNQGWSNSQIAKEVGHSQSQVNILLNKLGAAKREWKYSVNESFFEKIDSEEKAYVLGWMYADGNVTDDGRWRISLKESDLSIIEKIKDVVVYTGPVHQRDGMAEICVSRKKMCDDLCALGCVPRKSLILEFPSMDRVPFDLLNHFMRGVYDGDGSLSLKNGKYLSSCLVSSVSFNMSWSEILSAMGIRHKTYYKKGKPNSPHLMTTSRFESEKLCRFLYEGATICLKRKKDIYLKHLKILDSS